MKKVISLLIAVIMLMSAIAVSAAPTVDYVFYDEDDQAYYVFGTYDKNVIKNSDYLADEVGVYLNGDKYQFDAVADSNELVSPKYGIGFYGRKDILNTLNITPYSVDKIAERKGSPFVYDTVSQSKVLSDNADLKELSVSRKNYNTFLMMYPEFSPEVENYTVKANFTGSAANNNSAMASVISAIAVDPAADVDVKNPTANDGTATITVTAQNGRQKVYTIKFEIYTPTLLKATTADLLYHKPTQPSNAPGVQSTANTMYLTEYTVGADSRTQFYKFDLTSDAIKAAQNISFSFSSADYTGSTLEYNNNVAYALKKVTVDSDYELGKSSMTYQDILDDKITIGDEIVGRVGGINYTTYRGFITSSIDVTKVVKKAIADGESYIVFQLMIDGFDIPATATATNLNVNVYAAHATYGVKLVY